MVSARVRREQVSYVCHRGSNECLSMQWFKNRIDAKILIEEYRCHNRTRQVSLNELSSHLIYGDMR